MVLLLETSLQEFCHPSFVFDDQNTHPDEPYLTLSDQTLKGC
jgi:hypothetical protein